MMFPALLSLALHEWPHPFNASTQCVSPGTCTPPSTKFSRVMVGPTPGQQWNTAGGFCGAFSVQHAALAKGAWVSQDLVRKANRDQPGSHHMHGDTTVGWEVMPSNVAYTAKHLKLSFDEWDYTQPSPQAPAFKKWLKKNLVAGNAIAWFPLCKGDGHECYEGSCPNGGAVDHVEPMWGIYSNHELNDTTVYDDDWIVHASDQDQLPYYRTLASLDDTTAMEGNCANAQPGFGRNEMYPCFDTSVTYGLAVTGLAVSGTTVPTAITTSGSSSEPNVRRFQRASTLHATVHVSELTVGSSYTTYRFDSTDALPSEPPFAPTAAHSWTFRAAASTYSFADENSFSSDSSVYYVTVPGSSAAGVGA